MLRFACLLALALILGISTARAQPPFHVADADPGLSGLIPLDGPLFLRIVYRSDRPIRFQAEGFAGGKKIEAGVRYNPAPANAAGDGEALVWIAYRVPVTLDRIMITATGEDWKPIAAIQTPVSVTWSKDAGATVSRSAWASRMNEDQQRRVSVPAEPHHLGFEIFGMLIMLSVPLYFALQAALPMYFAGGWRAAALAPLLVGVPATVHALWALAMGSNIWPIVLIFASVLGCAYLLVLLALRALAAWITALPAKSG